LLQGIPKHDRDSLADSFSEGERGIEVLLWVACLFPSSLFLLGTLELCSSLVGRVAIVSSLESGVWDSWCQVEVLTPTYCLFIQVTLLTKLGAEVVAVDNGRQALDAVAKTLTAVRQRSGELGLTGENEVQLRANWEESKKRSPTDSSALEPPRSGEQLQEGANVTPNPVLGESEPVRGGKIPRLTLGEEIEEEEERPGLARAFDCLLMDCQVSPLCAFAFALRRRKVSLFWCFLLW
jgi:CheY-like chemotaxis protein